MKKLSFLFIFLFPFFLHAQYGVDKCHADLVFGFDIGNSILIPAEQDRSTTENDKLIYGFRLGTNINFPIGNKMLLVTGFRLSDRMVKTYNAPLISHEAYTEKSLHNFFVEIPFRGRYLFGYSKKQNHLYLEGGLDVNIYIASFAKDNIEQAFGRAENYNPFSLSVNLAPGFEMESNRNEISYFVQPIVRVQVTPKIQNSGFRFYHIGLETGIRF